MAAKPLRALILDPYEESAGIIRNHLEQKKVEIVGWAKKGKGWMKLFNEGRPDLVFVELMLPEKDGIFCINSLCVQAPGTCCIFMHSFVGEMANNVEKKALRAGATAVLQKPFVSSRFNAMMDRFLAIRDS